MHNLYTYSESLIGGYNNEYLDVISLISIICAVLVITVKNPIVSVLFLIGLFFSIACYLMLLGINYIGLSYLLVYVGAVSILFLFILMLINVRVSELSSDTSNSIPLAVIMIVLFNFFISKAMFYINNIFNVNKVLHDMLYSNMLLYNSTSTDSEWINFVTSNSWDSNIVEINHISSIGNIIYSSYSIWLIITSIILLLAMVGAIIITVKQNK